MKEGPIKINGKDIIITTVGFDPPRFNFRGDLEVGEEFEIDGDLYKVQTAGYAHCMETAAQKAKRLG